jgi:hypothetical protein
MKKLILLFTILLPCLVSAQEIKEEQPSKSYEYMSYSRNTHKLTLSTDNGFLADEKGKARFFKNSIEMMSFFGRDGWEFVLAVSTDGFDINDKSALSPLEYYFKKDVTGWSVEDIENFLSKYKLKKIAFF